MDIKDFGEKERKLMDISVGAFMGVQIHIDSALRTCMDKAESSPLAHHGLDYYSNSDAAQNSNNNKIKVSVSVILISKVWLTTVPVTHLKQNKRKQKTSFVLLHFAQELFGGDTVWSFGSPLHYG